MAGPRVPCVGAVILDDDGRLLLIRRGRPPGVGLWSLPGGRVEAGESDPGAVAREVAEETGLWVSVGRLLGTVERPGPSGETYVIRDYVCSVVGETLRAGDDATDARWVAPADLPRLPTTPGLLEALTGWGVIPLQRDER
ncbi:NUDIX hydrolase [Actinopolymorpha alba]|uniref:NUDIX hydrolase n=1 Tax=Actinopolymorpha alba TaxID=533267 RepID=UPI0004758855|nr:NUDIX domain-containing protein [Actinopolymorpha alba]